MKLKANDVLRLLDTVTRLTDDVIQLKDNNVRLKMANTELAADALRRENKELLSHIDQYQVAIAETTNKLEEAEEAATAWKDAYRSVIE